jgi:response regulator of citrate/malate metabolism
MILDQENIIRIKKALRFKSKGMSISEIASQLQMNRNSVAKYLEILSMPSLHSGDRYYPMCMPLQIVRPGPGH